MIWGWKLDEYVWLRVEGEETNWPTEKHETFLSDNQKLREKIEDDDCSYGDDDGGW